MKAGFTPDFVEKVNFLIGLIGLGIINEQPMKVNGTTVIPMDVRTACLAKLPQGRGEKLEYTALMLNRPYKGLTSTQYIVFV